MKWPIVENVEHATLCLMLFIFLELFSYIYTYLCLIEDIALDTASNKVSCSKPYVRHVINRM